MTDPKKEYLSFDELSTYDRTEIEKRAGERALDRQIKQMMETERINATISRYKRKFPNLVFTWNRFNRKPYIIVRGAGGQTPPLIEEPLSVFPSDLALSQMRLLDG